MTMSERLVGVVRLFLDTAPVIYYVENNPAYQSRLIPVFERVDAGIITTVSSPVTLAECLIVPLRQGNQALVDIFIAALVNGDLSHFAPIDDVVAADAADLRSRYNLSLTDALQLSTAIQTGCDAFLTNDATLRRVHELSIIVLDDIDQQ